MKRLFCFSQHEFDALLRSRGEDWRVYLALRKRADFGSGRLQHPSALRLTAASLARELSLSASRGQPALELGRLQVSRAIKRLVATGLIDEFRYKQGYIRLRLPLAATDSPMPETGNAKLIQTAPVSPAMPIRGQRDADTTSGHGGAAHAVICDTTGGGKAKRGSDEDGSRLIRDESGMSSESPVITGITPAGGHALSTQKQSVHPTHYPGGDISPAAHQNHPAAFGGSAVEIEETPENRYRRIVEDEGQGIIRFTRSDLSRQVFKSWSAIKVKERDLRDAVREVICDASRKPTPHSVDDVLRTMLNSKKGGIDAYKGRLAL